MAIKPTKEQKLIIKHRVGNAMVNAGPGCAKTTTLALATQAMLKDGIDPSHILLMTYSKALTADIKKAVSIKQTLSDSEVHVSTIHSFALKLVSDNFRLLGLDAPPSLVKQNQKNRYIKGRAKKQKLNYQY